MENATPNLNHRKGALVEQGSAFMQLEGGRMRGSESVPAPKVGTPERIDAVVIGAGQAGLSVGHHLARRGVRFVILEAAERIGTCWRQRWDSLRLFTPAQFSRLDGMPFPAPRFYFPTKDEMADYLEAYAARFNLPVRTGMRVTQLARDGERYLVTAGEKQFSAAQVVVASASYQKPHIPGFAGDLDAGIRQLHSFEYRNPGQLRPGPVLLVGAGNSGAEIARELAPEHQVLISGPDVGHLPFTVDGFLGRHGLVRIVLRGVFHRLLTVRTPPGRKLRKHVLAGHSGPLIRVKPRHLAAAGVERVERVTGTSGGQPRLADGRVLKVANVIWCTGFRPGLDWIKLPIFDGHGHPEHERGIVSGEPGLAFVGLHFQYSLSSSMIHGVGRDARHVADIVAERLREKAVAA